MPLGNRYTSSYCRLPVLSPEWYYLSRNLSGIPRGQALSVLIFPDRGRRGFLEA